MATQCETSGDSLHHYTVDATTALEKNTKQKYTSIYTGEETWKQEAKRQLKETKNTVCRFKCCSLETESTEDTKEVSLLFLQSCAVDMTDMYKDMEPLIIRNNTEIKIDT